MLEKDGYTVLPNVFNVNDAIQEQIFSSKFTNIFNSVKDGKLQYSTRRQQSKATEKWCRGLTRQLKYVLTKNDIFEKNIHKLSTLIALKSVKGCEKQTEHCDSAPLGYFQGKTHFPMACVIALQNETKMYIRSLSTNNEKCLLLQKGDLLLFRGDVKHCGADYDKLNIRLHAYIDILEYKRPKNKTFI